MAQSSQPKVSRPKIGSTLGFGLLSTLFIYGDILITFNRPIIQVPAWLWFVALPILIVGLYLQFWSRRVLWIRLYQTLTTGLAGFTNTLALWLVWQRIQPGLSLLIGFMSIVAFFACIVLSYSKTLRQNRDELATMPHGPIGTITSKTGILSLEITPEHITRRNQARVRKDNQLQKWIPLIIGLSFFIRRMYGQTGNLVSIIFICASLEILCGMIAGSFAVYVIAIRRWEQQHHLHLYLQRR